MAQSIPVDILTAQLWPQGDARDPLGVWGGRHIVTADVTEGPLKVSFQPGAERAGAYVYTCYMATIAQLTASEIQTFKCRLLTNWPDVDDDAGVQGAATLLIVSAGVSATFTAPFGGPQVPLVTAAQRLILLFDPRPVAGAFTIVELEATPAVDTQQYAFETWGYYWDRGVLNAPGGPRHPGSS